MESGGENGTGNTEEDTEDENVVEGNWEEKTSSTSYSFPASVPQTKKTTTSTNTAMVYIQNAKTWCMDYKEEVGETSNEINIQGELETVEHTEEELQNCTYGPYSELDANFPDTEAQTTCTKTQTAYSNERLLYSTKTDTRSYTWTRSTATDKTINYSRFLGTLKNDTGEYYIGSEYKEDGIEIKYPEPGETRRTLSAVDSITDSSGQSIEWLISLLSIHEKLEKQEELMMYFWNIYMNEDIYDIDIGALLGSFVMDNMSTISGSALENYIKAWENDTLWKYEKGISTTFPTEYLSQDEQSYIVYEDGSNGHNNISYGIATFIESSSASVNHPVYGQGYYNWKDEFAIYGVDVSTLKTGDLVPVDAAQAVYDKILNGFEQNVDSYLSTHGITLSQAQRDALVAVCYQYGNIYGFAEAYNASLDEEGNIDPEAIKDNFILTARSDRAKPFSDQGRKYANWYLFTEETYIDRSGNIIPAFGGTILECAKMIHDYMSDPAHLYYYCLGGSESSRQVHRDAGIANCGLNASFEESQIPGKYGYRLTCCATYVSWVLKAAGYLETHTNSAQTLRRYLDELGWQAVTTYDQLQAGDVVFMDTDGEVGHSYSDITHVQIYVGDGTWYNAGGNTSIHIVEPYYSNVSGEFVTAYRAPY